MLQLLHRLKVKRVGLDPLNPISKTGATGVWKVLLKRICSKRFRQQKYRGFNAVQCTKSKVRPYLNTNTCTEYG